MKKILVTAILGIITNMAVKNIMFRYTQMGIKFRAKLLMVELGRDLTINKKVMQILAKKRI